MEGELWLHLGCGERVLDGFVNVDFIPHDRRVMSWDLLDLWPEALTGTVEGIFSEDVLEHFFHAEQTYILCNANRALRPNAIFRILMPNLGRLVEYAKNYNPAPDEFLRSFGAETGADALNMGLRFSGHRWLHDSTSLARLAELCGFGTESTPCATSSVQKFRDINLRDETNSLSFATDLRKLRTLDRVLLMPESVRGARVVEDVGNDTTLFVATSERPVVSYSAGSPIDCGAVACINIRSSNISSFHEHSLKTLILDEVNREKPWYFDETMKSRPCMNLITRSQLNAILGEADAFSRLRFSPAAHSGSYFTLGCAEIFLFL
jgi:predicted SAM-dependent methyltransferase